MQEDNSAINLKAVYYSLFFNNACARPTGRCVALPLCVRSAALRRAGRPLSLPRRSEPRVASRRIYLFAMAFFGFYFLRGQSLEVNYVTSLLITMAIMFFANQEL